MTVIYLCRHAISLANLDYNIGQTVYDVDLHEKGFIQANILGDNLQNEFKDKRVWIILSPLKRTKQTATPLMNKINGITKSLKISVEPLCRERKKQTSDLLNESETGCDESWDLVINRCNLFKQLILDSLDKNEFDIIIVFSHHGFISMLLENKVNPQNAIPIKTKWSSSSIEIL